MKRVALFFIALMMLFALSACEVTADFTELNSLITQCEELVEDDFTVISWDNLIESLNAAKSVKDNTKATQEEVDEVKGNLSDAIDALVTVESVVSAFKTAHSEVLAKTVDNISATDKVLINSALAAYNGLANEVKAQLSTEKALLDSLLVKADELGTDDILAETKESKLSQIPSLDSFVQADYTVASWIEFETAINADIAAINGFSTVAEVEDYIITATETILVTIDSVANNFKATYAQVLEKTVDMITVSDKAAVNEALAVYGGLADEVKATLTAEKTVLDGLIAKIVELETDKALADAKELKLASVPKLSDYQSVNYTVASWTVFSAAINADITAINGFETVEEVAEYVIAANATVLVTVESVSSSFKTAHSIILGRTIETVVVADKTAVNDALTAYGQLPYEVQTDLIAEKELLDVLLIRIGELEQEKALADAKELKLSQIPSLDSYNQDEYTVISWAELETAIDADIAAINGFSTVEEIEEYLITANSDMLVLISDVAEEFKSEYARVLALTTTSVKVADKNDLDIAFAAFNRLPEEVQAKMSTQKNKFNSLIPLVDAKLAKFADLLRIEDYEADKTSYTTDSWETFVFAIYVDNLFIDTATTVSALTGYTLRTSESLLVEIADVIEKFKINHAQVLGLTEVSIALSHKDSLLAAIAEYYWLSDEVAQGVDNSVGISVKDKLESLLTALSNINRVTVSNSAELLNALKSSTDYNIYIPNGTYNLNAFQITAAKNIVGESKEGVIINITGHTSSQAALVIKSNSILRNLTIVADSDYAAIKVTTIGNGFVDRVVFENVKISGGKGLNIHGVLSATLINVEVDNVLASQYVALSIAESNVTIIDSKFSSGKYGSIGIMYGSSYTTGYTLKIDDKTAVSSYVYLETYKSSGYTVLVPKAWPAKTGTIALKSNNMIFTSESIEKAAEFIEKHSAVAELTLETVGIEHIDMIEAAIADYEELDAATQKLLKAAKEYADSLLEKAESLL